MTPVGPHAERAVVGDDPHGLQPVGVLAAAAKRPLTTHAVATIDRDGGAGGKTSVTKLMDISFYLFTSCRKQWYIPFRNVAGYLL